MPTQIQPLSWQGFDLANPYTVKVFQTQLAQAFNQIITTLNQIQISLTSSQNDFGTISTDQTINANGAAAPVLVAFTSTTLQTRLITINNLAYGTPVFINANVTASTLTLKIAATLPGGTSYTVFSFLTSTLAQTSMSTGLAIASSVNAQFFAIAQPRGGSPFLFFYNV